jgi:hypothetical protein
MVRLFLLLLIPFFLSSYSSKERIDEIYTESSGNNPYEAKIKALDRAMNRAFLLLVDKLLIDNKSISKVPRTELSSLFSDIKIKDENIKTYSSGSSYSAVVSFTFSQARVNEIIQKYADEKTKEKFLNALIIPVFKINNVISLDHDKRKWVSSWQNKRPDLSDNKLYVIDHSLDSDGKINSTNIMNLTYDDFMEILPYRLFKKVIITIAEFFTDKSNGSTFLKVKNTIIAPEGISEESTNYNLESSRDALPKLIDQVISEFSQKHGSPRIREYYTNSNQSDEVIEDLINSEKPKIDKSLVFLMDISYPGEIEQIQQKLHSIKEISRFKIEIHYEHGYKVKLFTEMDMLTLADRLYYTGLSFYYNQFQNPVLINIPDDRR